MEYTKQEILSLEQRFRTTFINSLGGFKSLGLIGTKSKQGQTNLAVFNSFFHVGANPPLFGFIVRPDSVERHTLSNILDTGVFTVNHVQETIFIKAHQTSARYPNDHSEFYETELEEFYREDFYAPFVKESSIRIGAELVEKVELRTNGTVMLLAGIVNVSLPDSCLTEDGFVDLEKAGTLTCSGLDAYYKVEKLARLTYAKPGKWPDRFK